MKYRANPRGRMDEPKVQLMRQVMTAVGTTVADDVETGGLGSKGDASSMEFNTAVGMGGMAAHARASRSTHVQPRTKSMMHAAMGLTPAKATPPPSMPTSLAPQATRSSASIASNPRGQLAKNRSIARLRRA